MPRQFQTGPVELPDDTGDIWLSFRQPAQLLNLNGNRKKIYKHGSSRPTYKEMHRMEVSVLKKQWREAGRKAAIEQLSNHEKAMLATHVPGAPWLIQAVLPVSTRHKRDPDNLTATHKPIVDGFVDAGLFIDDSEEFVTVHNPIINYDPDFAHAPIVHVRFRWVREPFWPLDFAELPVFGL